MRSAMCRSSQWSPCRRTSWFRIASLVAVAGWDVARSATRCAQSIRPSVARNVVSVRSAQSSVSRALTVDIQPKPSKDDAASELSNSRHSAAQVMT